MGWIDYFRLYEANDGNLSKASIAEKRAAARANPNDPLSAKRLAYDKWYKAKRCGCGRLVEVDSYLDPGDDARHCHECRVGIEQIDEDNRRKLEDCKKNGATFPWN